MTYEQALKVLTQKQSLGIMPGLSRIEKILEDAGNPQEKLKIIHIAGTNGKGTVSKIISQSLIDAGFKIGRFSSPWVCDYREQIEVNNKYIDKSVFASLVGEYSQYDATEFELLTVIMFIYFEMSKVDYAVIECGMGGLEDSTNAFSSPFACVITSVSEDHTNFLGNSIIEIAENKSGIIKKNTNVILYPNPKTEEVFEKKCKSENARLYKIPDYNSIKLNNIASAKKCLELCGVNKVCNYPFLPARQERIGRFILDGSHNPSAAMALADVLKEEAKAVCVLGMMRDKNIEEYIKIISPFVSELVLCSPSNSRAASCEELFGYADKYCDKITKAQSPLEALKIAEKKTNGLILICGSFFLARDLREYLF